MAVAVEGAIRIRPLAPADIPRVRKIERAAYGPLSPRTPFDRELRNGLAQYLVAEQLPDPGAAPPTDAHAGPRGWLQALLGRPNPPPILGFAGAWYTHQQLHLVTIAVDPDHQGRGIGQGLLLAVIDLALDADFDSVALEVRPSNEGARRLYRRYGFRHAGRLAAYYSDNGEDATVMLLEGLATRLGRAHLDGLRADFRRRYGPAFVTDFANPEA